MMRLGVLLAVVLSAPAWAQDAAFERIDATVAMSDGVHLEASLYLPKHPAQARVPLIVRHHGGGSNKESPFDVKYATKWVETGKFAALMYSVRGHGNSEGLFDFFGPRTTQDFSEMVDWVAANYGARVDTASIGSSGYSQGGGESLLPAAQDPRVKVLAIGNTFADLNYALNPNDAFKFAFATGIFVGAYTATASRVDLSLPVRWGATFYTDTEDLGALLLPSTTQELAGRSPQTYLATFIDRRIPIFWTNAWEDQLFPADHPERMLQPLAAAGVPVHYWFASGGHAAGQNFLPEEEQREAAMLAWFEQYLLGEPRGFSNAQQVDYWQRISGNPRKEGEWIHGTSPTWPIAGARTAAMYPHADGALALVPNADETATLINDIVSFNVANDALVHELAANVPGLGDVLDQVPESEGPLDTIRYTSEPLDAPLNVVGAPVVVVSQQSTHLTVQQLSAKVWDVSDDGAQLIWRGATSGMNGSEVRFALWPNAHRFERGHQLVLTISSVDFPTFKPDTEPWVATIDLMGTRVELPVVAGEKAGGQDQPEGGGPLGGALPVQALALLLLAGLKRRRRAFRGV